MSIVCVGLDLAKNVFALHGVNATGAVQLRQPKVARGKLGEVVAGLPPCTIGIEACSGAHHWARQFAQHCTAAQQLMRLCGVGETTTTTTAIVVMVGNGAEFSSGRQFAAWLGLVPGQDSSAGKARLGRSTKAGDPQRPTRPTLRRRSRGSPQATARRARAAPEWAT